MVMQATDPATFNMLGSCSVGQLAVASSAPVMTIDQFAAPAPTLMTMPMDQLQLLQMQQSLHLQALQLQAAQFALVGQTQLPEASPTSASTAPAALSVQSSVSTSSRSSSGSGKSYQGVVKSFNEEKRWGLLQCDETFKTYGKDVFFMKSALRCGRIVAGNRVAFNVKDTPRGPQGEDVMSLEPGADWSTQNLIGKAFVGTVKIWEEEKGWGFVQCDQTMATFGKDMFIHKRECGETGDLRVGSVIQFTADLGRDGRPEVRNVRLSSAAPSESADLVAATLSTGMVMPGSVPDVFSAALTNANAGLTLGAGYPVLPAGYAASIPSFGAYPGLIQPGYEAYYLAATQAQSVQLRTTPY